MRFFAIGLVLAVAGCGGGDGARVVDGGAGDDAARVTDGGAGDDAARVGDAGAGDGAVVDGAVGADAAVGLDAAVGADAAVVADATVAADAFVSTAPVAMVTVTPVLAPMIVATEAQLVAELRDAGGNVLTGRAIVWLSADPARVSVSAAGLVQAVALGGPVEVTATSEGVTGRVMLSVVDGVVSGIANIHTFLTRCPTNDPAYAAIRADYELRSDDVPVPAAPACTEPYGDMPIAGLTDELYVLQALRIAYYMSPGTEGHLPWTMLGFWPWMHARVSGINLKSGPNQLYCCDQLDGKLFFAMSRQSAGSRESKRDWPGLSSTLAFLAHEVRHADPGPGHTNGCPAFPSSGSPFGCDPSYSPPNLGSYGLQYWLESKWADGSLYIGIPCAPTSVAQSYLADAVQQANSFIDRFVTSAPPAVTARRTYGGPCP